MEQVKFAKKLSVGDMGFDKKMLQAIVEKEPKETELLFVMALVTAMKMEPNRKDPSKVSYRFQGQFEVRNLLNGEVANASECFMPGAVEAFLYAAKTGAGEGAVRTAFTVGVMVDKTENSATGYKFTMKPWVDKKDNDPFKDLRGLLPAPKTDKGKK
jgi:hypothetical protein